MASFKGDIKSKALSMDIALNVILPYDHPHDYSQDPCKTLWLLHGQVWITLPLWPMSCPSSAAKCSA